MYSMFQRVPCTENEADALRFLWYSECVEEPPSDRRMSVHLFWKADSPSVATRALRTATGNRGNFRKEKCCIQEFLWLLIFFTYLLTSNQVIANAKEVQAAIPADKITIKNIALDKLPIERALGLHWDTETDTFGGKELLSHLNHSITT